ncbi:hypothetical protein GCM10010275_51650 [Streptomyces litmocidini]|uniref:hypothetical protein n=1 Tax=Streptomyces litmocidini TaxID=67318 RepID=UPI00167E29D8|nr:hypothetical protein [Streptomyces litmocidini]GGV05659.1 hypothetical protein GCM10010275_51650 [Streptomyces litmocidini]
MVEDTRRYAFLSASFLSKQYKAVPPEVLENAIFLFGGKRSWLFPENREEMLEARNLPAKYLEFDEDFKTLIRHKEDQGLAFWLLPDKDYKKVSAWIEGITDPVSKENYRPLILDESWWLTEFISKDAKFAKDAQQIIDNFKQGEFDYDSVMELLYQGNPTIVPTLYWAEG